MSLRVQAGLALILVAGVVIALTARQQPAIARATQQPERPAEARSREADREAILKSSRDFTTAFNKQDAKTIGTLWTDGGEFHAADGSVAVGRADIEAAFADFFKTNPQAQIDLLVEAVRFPAADLAIEEGILRQTRTARDLPASTVYRVTHVREGGQWRMVVSDEIGAGVDRLDDLDWLLGEWKGSAGDREMTLTFTREAKKPFIQGKFVRTEQKKEIGGGTLRIGFDPESGRLRSWHFDDDGGHGQAQWVRDGNRWVLDSTGVLSDGTATASVNVLGRVDANTITWMSVDRVLGNQALPDTVPVRLVRTSAGK